MGPHAMQDHCQMAGHRDALAMPRRLATFMPHARSADHFVLWIGGEWAAS